MLDAPETAAEVPELFQISCRNPVASILAETCRVNMSTAASGRARRVLFSARGRRIAFRRAINRHVFSFFAPLVADSIRCLASYEPSLREPCRRLECWWPSPPNTASRSNRLLTENTGLRRSAPTWLRRRGPESQESSRSIARRYLTRALSRTESRLHAAQPHECENGLRRQKYTELVLGEDPPPWAKYTTRPRRSYASRHRFHARGISFPRRVGPGRRAAEMSRTAKCAGIGRDASRGS